MSVAYQAWVQQFVDVLSPVAVKTFRFFVGGTQVCMSVKLNLSVISY